MQAVHQRLLVLVDARLVRAPVVAAAPALQQPVDAVQPRGVLAAVEHAAFRAARGSSRRARSSSAGLRNVDLHACSLRRAYMARIFARLPQVAIEHHFWRPLVSRNSQPQSRPGQRWTRCSRAGSTERDGVGGDGEADLAGVLVGPVERVLGGQPRGGGRLGVRTEDGGRGPVGRRFAVDGGDQELAQERAELARRGELGRDGLAARQHPQPPAPAHERVGLAQRVVERLARVRPVRTVDELQTERPAHQFDVLGFLHVTF